MEFQGREARTRDASAHLEDLTSKDSWLQHSGLHFNVEGFISLLPSWDAGLEAYVASQVLLANR